jgi:hypothetical protein
MLDVATIHDRLVQLHLDLERLSDRDPEQEVRGLALPVIDSVGDSGRASRSPGDLGQSGLSLTGPGD